jgi:hypothetical protein
VTIFEPIAMLLVFCLCVMAYIVHQVTAGIYEGIDEAIKRPANILNKHPTEPQT